MGTHANMPVRLTSKSQRLSSSPPPSTGSHPMTRQDYSLLLHLGPCGQALSRVRQLEPRVGIGLTPSTQARPTQAVATQDASVQVF